MFVIKNKVYLKEYKNIMFLLHSIHMQVFSALFMHQSLFLPPLQL